MEVTLAIIFAALGAAVGSFLNVCIDRLPGGRSLVYPASHCDQCQRALSPRDMVPVFSYLWLRGRCRHCRMPIPKRVLVVEILGCAYFLLAFWRFGLSAEFAITAFWGCVFLVIMFIDWEHQLILNKITYPMAVVALVILGIDSFLLRRRLLTDLILLPEPSILSGLVGGGIGFVFFLAVILIYPQGMGWGDIKLACLIGLATGFPLVFVALFIGIFIGGLVAIAYLLLKVEGWKDVIRLSKARKWTDATRLLMKGRKDKIPYGAFLGIGPMVTLLWGNQILTWYASRFLSG